MKMDFPAIHTHMSIMHKPSSAFSSVGGCGEQSQIGTAVFRRYVVPIKNIPVIARTRIAYLNCIFFCHAMNQQ